MNKVAIAEPAPGRLTSGLSLAWRTQGFASGSTEAWALHYAGVKHVKEGRDVIILTIGDPDFDTPPEIVASCVESLKRGETHYIPPAGISELIEKIASVESIRLSREISTDNVVVTKGAQNGLFLIMQCIVAEGDAVITFDPAYTTFPAVIECTGASHCSVPLAFDGERFRFDLDAMEAAITPNTRAILLNAPHNPTGASLSHADAHRIVSLCHDKKIWLICDEVYADLCYDAPYTSPMQFPEAATCAIAVRSMSKSHAMPGWRVGWNVAPAELVPHLQNNLNCMMFGGSEFIQHAAITGLDMNTAQEMTEIYRRRRDVVLDQLANTPRIRTTRPDAGIFMLLDVRDTGLSETDFAWCLLEGQGVAVLPTASFGVTGEGFVRISLCVSETTLAEAARRIREFAVSL